IDELGYLTLKPEQANAFFKLMDRRYGRKSTIITTNLDYPEWYDLFQRNRSHSLAADRLLQGFNRGQIAPKCVFPTDYALKPEKGCWLSGGKVNNYLSA
ncbi:MAG: ATP-binding protein, partial [Deltaproteobacteria bacterium]|nr:ATP-binding protein [Deltaproteobacteria bacterium]